MNSQSIEFSDLNSIENTVEKVIPVKNIGIQHEIDDFDIIGINEIELSKESASG